MNLRCLKFTQEHPEDYSECCGIFQEFNAADAVYAAVKCGYRLIDTAQAYGNERGVGMKNKFKESSLFLG